MKKKLLMIVASVLLGLGSVTLNAQSIYIPDDNFEQYFISLGYDNALDNYVNSASVNWMTSLNIGFRSITDLTGIQDFTNLQSLYCFGNSITSLTLKNMPNLTTIDCSDNLIETLDVSGLTSLTTLYCGDNNLKSVNLTGCSNLNEFLCFKNSLTTLNLSGLTSLSSFDCTQNTSLACIQVNNVAAADANSNWKKDALASYSLACVTPKFTYVPDDKFENGLIVLGYDNVLDNYVNTANIEGLTNLDISDLAITDLTGIEDFKALTKLNCSSNSFTSINLSGLTNLNELLCGRNKSLTSLDCSGLPELTTLNVFSSALTSLNVSGLTKLSYINCNLNALSTLNVSGLTSLNTLYCAENNLSSLNVSGLTSLIDLECNKNKLTSLNCTGLTSLANLICYENKLTSLTVSGLTSLNKIQTQNNNLTSLDVSGLTNLKELTCNNNNLSSLNLINTTSLTNLSSTINPSLLCIQVSNVAQAIAKTQQFWFIDNQSIFNLDCSVTSIDESSNIISSNIFPNPSKGIFTVQNAIGVFTIQNMVGEFVYSSLINSTNEIINISHLSNGVYYVNINGKVSKVIKE